MTDELWGIFQSISQEILTEPNECQALFLVLQIQQWIEHTPFLQRLLDLVGEEDNKQVNESERSILEKKYSKDKTKW